ncbi:RNA methyltransferase [Psittacicella gerlachiana]|uniref:tRNA (cytidine/uridine-2'-O-)-methyltransferase TrmJ n=1 Tax=Psittacicella gerlachiana TaxID=2028574 RepID=A0A3A1YBM4_9GAMM|nr:RNA methyltransferase [Psittacicella gerlachiana]RIY34588.1 hypothetical protein CKF59_05320 [Psittacicella gerlachiana]
MQINLNHFTLIYINTTHPGNLGAIARAAKNMGIEDIRLVTPKANPQDEQAIANAAGAVDLLEKMKIYTSLELALADCKLIFGTSARTRTLNPTIVSPEQILETTRDNLQHELTKELKVAILFGTEKSGLTNDELNLANYHIVIEANPDYTSLNLAMATLLISYSLRQQVHKQAMYSSIQAPADVANSEELATQADYSSYFHRLEQHYRKIGFIQHSMVIPRLLHIYKKAKLTKKEIDLLQGMLTADIKQE